MKLITSLTLFFTFLFIVGCALEEGAGTVSTVRQGGQKITTKVFDLEDGTTKTIVTTEGQTGVISETETIKDAQGNIISSNDPNAEKLARVKQEQQSALDNAPKRDQSDAIKLALFKTIVDEELKQVSVKGGIFPYIRKEFENDPILKLYDQKKLDAYEKERDFKSGKEKRFGGLNQDSAFLSVDVYVKSKALLRQEYGVSKATNKLASAQYVHLEATIHSEYDSKTWTVKESGPIFKNAEVIKNFSNQIRTIILEEIGPTIPAEAWKYRRNKNLETMDKKDAKDALRSLFK